MTTTALAPWRSAVAALVAASAVAASPPGGTAPANPDNRLGNETSPYLLQHANNPVNWYPWGPEAFEAARIQGKPIFISVGYSTCYWCHVMERESFENDEIAAIMNEHFISIKVDREERPDVDDIYMAAVQSIAGRGGWPMSVFLEPQTLQPFEGGTYFPPTPRGGRQSFPQLLDSVSELWRTDPDQVRARAKGIAGRVRATLAASSQPQTVGRKEIDRAVTLLLSAYDRTHGGFSRSSRKFPQPPRLELLLGAGWDRPAVRDAVTHTLDRMAMGGIYDQVGGGFHRYSTDSRWLVPHFEKMLYDNAQLASVYAKAYVLTGDPFYGEVLRETLDYVLREMTSPQGGFYSAQDAEVKAREGRSYIWKPAEIADALGDCWMADEIDFALEVYGLNAGGNFRDPHHPGEGFKNVLYLPARPDAMAEKMGVGQDVFDQRLAAVNECLLAVRNDRDQPGTDTKVLTGWNGLMIKGMVDGARALGDPWYFNAAERAARFVLDTMRAPDGGLLRSYRSGTARIDGLSRDYAMFIAGLIALHRGTAAPGDEDTLTEWLTQAVELAGIAKTRFWDASSGGYFDTEADQSDLFVRTKSTRDGVLPCANSLMLLNLMDLYELTGDEALLDDAASTLLSTSSRMRSGPTATALSTLGLHEFLQRYPQLLPGTQPAQAVIPAEDPVEVIVSRATADVSPDAPARFDVTLKVLGGYHINAHDPGAPGLIGVELQLVGRGCELEASYPPGVAFRLKLLPDDILVHSGTVTIPVVVRQVGDNLGRPRIILAYQVCTDQYCLEPVRTILPIELIGR